MRKHIALGAALILGVSGSAFGAEGVSYNFVDGAYGYTDYKGVGGHEDSFSVGGSYGFAESFVGFGDISTWDGAGSKGTHMSAGLGWHTGVSDALDFLAGVSFKMIDPKGFSSDTGYGAKIGLRGRMGMNVELNGGVDYYDFGQGDDGFEFSVGGRYYFNDAFSSGLGFTTDDSGDAKMISVVLRYDFGG